MQETKTTTPPRPQPVISQATVVGRPQPRTWDELEAGCLANFGGGHRSGGHLEAFQHGMQTVFNLLRAELPPLERIKTTQATASKWAGPCDPPQVERMKAALRSVTTDSQCARALEYLVGVLEQRAAWLCQQGDINGADDIEQAVEEAVACGKLPPF